MTFENIPGTIICRLPGTDSSSPEWGIFTDPIEIVTAYHLDDVKECLARIDKLTKTGKYAAGFISYEAAPAFDEAHSVNELRGFPLIWFGIYSQKPEIYIKDVSTSSEFSKISTIPEISQDKYLAAIHKIKEYILEGDIYQANFTFRVEVHSSLKPLFLFEMLFNKHPVPYAAFINTGDEEIVSISPELFLEKNGDEIKSLPMKGTAQRKLNYHDDLKAAEALSLDSKNRAENIMIVDMMRNDLGRICHIGSVKTDPVFHVDTYNTVHQMISGVHGVLPEAITIPEIFAATFPAASITGAPKIRAMQIIAEQETSPRKVYTGTIGCIIPGGDFCFNVAIRTLIYSDHDIELGIGSGIVADSDPLDEWRESLLKSTFISRQLPEFELLETILWTAENGFAYLEEHLKRLRNSHKYFMWAWDREKVMAKLMEKLDSFDSAKSARVRLRTSQHGNIFIDVYPLSNPGWAKELLNLKISPDKTNSEDLFLYHKTTNREFYNTQFKQALGEGFDEVIFTNEKDEVTEGAISNIFIRKDGYWFTPPVNCGLLEGVWRAAKCADLNAEDKVLYLEDLKTADKVLIGNSVRGGGYTAGLI